MGHFFQKNCFRSYLKITSKNVWWKKLPGASLCHQPLIDHTSRELFHSLATSSEIYKTGINSKLFTHFKNCKCLIHKPSPRCLSTNQIKKIYHPGDIGVNHAYTSSASLLENDGTVVEKNGLKVNNKNDILLSAQVESFMEKLQSCTTADEILTLAEAAMQTKSLPVECLSTLFSTYQKQIYNSFTFPWLFSEHRLKKKQLEWNEMNDEIVPYTTDDRFQNLIDYSETQLDDISYSNCVDILYSLLFLNINNENSNFANKVFDKCTESLDKFNLSELAIFSINLRSQKNPDLLGKIIDSAKIWLQSNITSPDLDIGDLCTLFDNGKFLVSNDMLELGCEAVIRKLSSDPASVTLDMISKTNLFVGLVSPYHNESLINRLLNLPSECFNVDVTSHNLTFTVCSAIGGSTWLSPLLQTLRAQCVLELSKTDCLSVHELVKYSYLLKKLPLSIMEKNRKKFVQFVKESDNLLIFMLMPLLSSESLKLPGAKEILWAYHQRLVRLFASLSETQQQQLMWKGGGYFGRRVFETVEKLKESGIQPNRDLARVLENHFQLQPDVWDVPPMKIVSAAIHASVRLKSNNLLTTDELIALTKFFNRLDLIYLLYLYRQFDLLSLSRKTPAAQKQCLDLRESLLDCFGTKLSSTDTLAPYYISHKVLPFRKSKHHWKTIGRDIYGLLMDSLPRLLQNQDGNNYMRILSLLDLSVERCPVYQKETFEKLINFITSSPKLLIYSGLHLVKVLAYNGYQPDNIEDFIKWTHQLSSAAIENKLVSKSTLVQLAYHQSLLGIFHDNLLLKIFSLDFLADIENGLEGVPPSTLVSIKQDLALLNQSVSIECLHLTVPWFSKSFLPEVRKSQSSDSADILSVIESVNRLIGHTGCVVEDTESPYGHRIDALMHFDPSSGIISCEDAQSNQHSPDIEKIALLFLQHHHFCYDSDFMTGRCLADIRQLQILGYNVVLFTEKELSSMEVSLKDSLDNYVRTKINNALHSEVFKDPKK